MKEIWVRLPGYRGYYEISTKFKVDRSNIRMIVKGKTWKHLAEASL